MDWTVLSSFAMSGYHKQDRRCCFALLCRPALFFQSCFETLVYAVRRYFDYSCCQRIVLRASLATVFGDSVYCRSRLLDGLS